MQIYDPEGDGLEPAVLARTIIRRNLRLVAAIGMTTGAIGAFVLSGRMLSQPAPSLVLGLTVGCALLFSVPLFALSFRPPLPQVALLEARIASSRGAGKPIRAFSTTFLVLVVAGGVILTVALVLLIPVQWLVGR